MVEPLSIAASIVGLIGGVYTIGKGGLAIKSSLSSAVAEFGILESEIQQFRGLWGAVEPILASPQPFITSELHEDLGTIYNGISNTLKMVEITLKRLIDTDKQQTGAELSKFQNGQKISLSRQDPRENVKRRRAGRLKLFFEGGEIKLRRGELQYAKACLDTVISVQTYAQACYNTDLNSRCQALAAERRAEVAFAEKGRSRKWLQEVEQTNTGKRSVDEQASRWLMRSPPPGSTDPVNELARAWISPTHAAVTSNISGTTTNSQQNTNELLQLMTLKDRVRDLEKALALEKALTAKQTNAMVVAPLRESQRPEAAKAAVEAHAWWDQYQHECGRHEQTKEQYRRHYAHFEQSEQDRINLRTAIAQLEADSAEAQEEAEQNTIGFQHQIQGLQQTIATLENQIQALQKKGEVNDAYHQKLRGRYQHLELEKQRAMTTIDDLGNDTARLRGERDGYRNDLRQLRREYRDLESRVTRPLLAEVQRLRDENQPLRDRVQRLEAQELTSLTEIQRLQAQNEPLQDEIRQLREENQPLRDRVQRLEGQNEQLRDRFDPVQAQMQKLQDEMNNFATTARERYNEQAGLLQQTTAELRDVQHSYQRERIRRKDLDAEHRRTEEKLEALQQNQGRTTAELQDVYRDYQRERRRRKDLAAEQKRTYEELEARKRNQGCSHKNRRFIDTLLGI